MFVLLVGAASSWRSGGLVSDSMELDSLVSVERASGGAEAVRVESSIQEAISAVDFADSTLTALDASNPPLATKREGSTVDYDLSGLSVPERPSSWPPVGHLSFSIESDPVVDSAVRPILDRSMIERYENISFANPDDPETWPSGEASTRTKISEARFVQPDDPDTWQTNAKVFQLPENSPLNVDPDDPATW